MKLLAILSLSAGVALAQFTSLYYCADAGASDTYACSISPAPIPLSYQTGFPYSFKANTANTGAASINFNSIGAATIVKVAGGVTTALADNDIRAGQVVSLVYDGTNMQMQSTSGNTSLTTLGVMSNGSVQLPASVTFPTVRDLTRTCATCSIDVDLYTPASGHQAFIDGCTFSNTGANTANFTPEIKISASYRVIFPSTVVSTVAVTGVNIGFVVDSTMTFAVHISDAASTTTVISCSVRDFVTPSSGPRIRSVLISTFASGDNTVYTVPAATTAYLVGVNLPGAMQAANASTLNYTNNSGGARTIQWNVVPSGSSPSTTGNAVSSSASIPDATSQARAFSGTLATGDFLSVNSSANTAGQVAWVTVVEQ